MLPAACARAGARTLRPAAAAAAASGACGGATRAPQPPLWRAAAPLAAAPRPACRAAPPPRRAPAARIAAPLAAASPHRWSSPPPPRAATSFAARRGRALASVAAPPAPPAPEAPENALVGATVLLDVSGMKCAGCSAAVTRVLCAHPSVARAAVNLVTETAAVTLRGDAGASADEVAAAVRAACAVRGCARRSV
jgi:copper chaperone CopZ